MKTALIIQIKVITQKICKDAETYSFIICLQCDILTYCYSKLIKM